MSSVLLSPSSGLPFVKRIFDLAMAGFLLCFFRYRIDGEADFQGAGIILVGQGGDQ
jgi:hypothetical protein